MHATSGLRTDFGLMAVLQRTVILRVVIKPQADTSLIAKSAHLCRKNTPRLGGNTASHTLERRKARMIFRKPHKVGSGRRARDTYAQKPKKPPQTLVHATGSKPPIGYATHQMTSSLPKPMKVGCTTPMKTPR